MKSYLKSISYLLMYVQYDKTDYVVVQTIIYMENYGIK